MDNNLSKFTCYAAFIVNGNLVTDLVSIGEKSEKTGPDPPGPATVAGLNTHNVFEGDSSMTRSQFRTLPQLSKSTDSLCLQMISLIIPMSPASMRRCSKAYVVSYTLTLPVADDLTVH